jgi:hypothetical protein
MVLLRGNITAIDNEMICLNASTSFGGGRDVAELSGDVCAGKGAITFLKRLDPKEVAKNRAINKVFEQWEQGTIGEEEAQKMVAELQK